MTKPDDVTGKQPVWETLADAGLVEIDVEEFPKRIRDVKQTVMTRLSELLESDAPWRERESAAYSLGTLKKLESRLEASVKET